jgi:phospholipase C
MKTSFPGTIGLIAMLCAACGGSTASDTDGEDSSAPIDSGARDTSTGGGDTSSSDDTRSSDTSDGGTSETTADTTPSDSGFPTPLRHVIVVIKENHTFDNYFGSFPGAEGTTTCKKKDGTTFPCPHAPDRTPRDLCHAHTCALTDWAEGKMDGWEDVSGASSGGDNLAWAQYGEADIPNYWAYAKAFTLGDHFFANELGPSFPGHTFVLAAQAGWAIGNPGTDITHPYWGCDQKKSTTIDILDKGTCTVKSVFPCFDIPSIPDILPAGVDWKFYGTSFYVLPEIWSMFNAIDGIRNDPKKWGNVVNVSQLTKDITDHKLPAVTWLVDQDLADEHPSVGGICAGENWTVGYINQLMESEYWNDTAIIFTMDDFGGWVDHVPPPRQYGCDSKTPYGLGFRLPLLIISPYAKPHYVFKEVAEEASIPRFIEKVFGIDKTLSSMDPAAQDGTANDLMGAFDFTQTPNPPLVLKTRTCL